MKYNKLTEQEKKEIIITEYVGNKKSLSDLAKELDTYANTTNSKKCDNLQNQLRNQMENVHYLVDFKNCTATGATNEPNRVAAPATPP